MLLVNVTIITFTNITDKLGNGFGTKHSNLTLLI